jgi:type I restriction enzyme M protein
MNQPAPELFNRRAGSDSLGRYYTKLDVSGLLISQMAHLVPSRVLDLGSGAGSLSRAVLQRWRDVELLTVDVDSEVRPQLTNLLNSSLGARHRHIHADALSDRLPRLLRSKETSIDAAVCNPPFIIPRWRDGFAKIIEEAGFSGCISVLSDVDAALLFLAQNLRLLGENATLGIIVPDSLVSASKYRRFRKDLLQKYVVRKAIRLPRHSFQGTDAQAHILVISKSNVSSQQVPLYKFDAQSQMSHELLVDISDAIERLDFDYHALRLPFSVTLAHGALLGSITQDVKRGSLSSSEARAVGFPVFHTTNMSCDLTGEWCDLVDFGSSADCVKMDRFAIKAQPGDILLARVGRNLEHKILGVDNGFPVLSDCVYRIRVPFDLRNTILKQLSSASGQAWLRSRCYGVSAKQISKADLLTFPLSF